MPAANQAPLRTVAGLGTILAVGAASLALAFQGWRSRIPDPDVVAYIRSALDFAQHGRVPAHGTVTSFGSFAPPGLSWLFLPGVLLSSDPRLAHVVGGALLHFGTLAGIFLLASRYLGVRSAVLATALYGFSDIGLYFAQGLWPRGLPFFYVWLVYFACAWAVSGKARHLAWCVITWASGVYVFMEMAPALLIVPAVWYLRRPRLSGGAVLFAAAITALIWSPYLQFEAARGFIDLRSQLLRQDVRSLNTSAWCDPGSPLVRTAASTPGESPASSEGRAAIVLNTGRRFLGVAGGLLANFHSALPGARFGLAGLTVLGIVFLSWQGIPWMKIERARVMTLPATGAALALITLGVVANEWLIGRLLAPLSTSGHLRPDTIERLRWFQSLVIFAGVLIGARCFIVRAVGRLAAHFRPASRDAPLLAVCLLVPWLTMMLVTEHSRPVRFAWLMPLQVIVLAACTKPIRRRMTVIAAGLVLLATLAAVPEGFELRRALADGWSGADHAGVRAVDFVAERLRNGGKSDASIGYVGYAGDEDVPTFTRIYRIGAEYDLLLRQRHSIVNANTCPEGVSANDSYRIAWAGFERTPSGITDGYRLERRFAGLLVYAKR